MNPTFFGEVNEQQCQQHSQQTSSTVAQGATAAAALVPETQAERLAVLEALQQIPLKIRAQQQQALIFA